MDETSLFLTSGNGPVECRAALSELIEILKVEAWNGGLRAEIALGPQPDAHGPKSAIVTLTGDGAQAFARRYHGTVQFIFKSRIRPGHKRQNWFVGVKPINLSTLEPETEDIRIEDLRFETLRAGGPGGQHRTRPTALCGQPTCRPASRSFAGTSAPSTATRRSPSGGSPAC
ncbi:hypothetical protein LJR254_000813 [Rhizobium sp. LjRoot254]